MRRTHCNIPAGTKQLATIGAWYRAAKAFHCMARRYPATGKHPGTVTVVIYADDDATLKLVRGYVWLYDPA